MNSAIERAITRIWEDYSEPLSLNEIAKSAILSRFHFSRVFHKVTSVSPGRYLSAVRIYQAKRLLATTELKVTEISFAVGYNSLGSFTNHFTDSVGLSPSRFRRMWAESVRESPQPVASSSSEHGVVAGTVTLPSEYATAKVYIGAFPTPIIQRRPVSWTVVDATADEPTRYCLPEVASGQWFIAAVAAADSVDPEPWTRRSLLLSGINPVTVTDDSTLSVAIALRPRRFTDLPVLYAIPDLQPQNLGHTSVARARIDRGKRSLTSTALTTPEGA